MTGHDRVSGTHRVTVNFVPRGSLAVTVTAFNFNRDDLARQDGNTLTSDLTC